MDVGALFNDIKVPPKPPAKPKATQSNKKSAKENKSAEQKALDEALNALQTSDKVAAPKAGLTGAFDEFNGKVRRIMMQRWQKYLATTNDKVLVQLIFSADGKLLRYNFISRSYDPEFQSKARDLREIFAYSKWR